MPRSVVVLVTCPNRRIGARLAQSVIEHRLAACVNLVPGIESVFRWQGKLERAREVLLIVKTTQGRLAALQRHLVSQHPYDVPEVIALSIVAGNPPYLAWIAQSVRPN